MTVPDEMTIPLGRGKIVLQIALSIGFVALGYWLFNMSDAEMHRHSPLYVHGVGLVSMGFFGLCGAAGVRKLFDTRPGLQFTRQGIVENSGRVIAWSDIVGFDVFKVKRTRLLVVKLRDPEKYSSGDGAFRHRMNEMNLRMCGSPITLSAGTLKIGFDQLQTLCESYLSKYGAAGRAGGL